MANTNKDSSTPTLTKETTELEGSKDGISKAVTIEGPRYEVRSGTVSIGNPTFTHLLNQVTSIKLDGGNFLLWKNIVLPILRSYKLDGHLTGKTPCPEMTIIIPPSEEEPNGLKIPNPEHDVWLAADQLLVGWFYNSMTPEVAAQVMGYDEAQALWSTIQETRKGAMKMLRQMLQQTRKGAMKMKDYLATMKRYYDNLLVAGCPIDLRSFFSYVLAGLDEEYTPIVCVIRSQNLTWSEMQCELFTFEQRQERLQALRGNVSVNLAQADKQKKTNPGATATNNQSRASYNQSSRGGRYRGRGRFSSYSSNNRPTCQICGKQGHTALICHHRYEKGEQQSQGSQSSIPTTSTNLSASSSSGPAALMAYPETVQDPTWYLDSGASNHVTSDIAKLTLKGDYTGKEVQGSGFGREA